MENRLPLPSHLARLPLLAGEDILLPKRASKRVSATLRKQELPSFLAAKSVAGGPLHRWMRIIITGGPFPWAFLLSLPLVCPTPAENWTSGAVSAPALLFSPLRAHGQPGHCDTLGQDRSSGLLKLSGPLFCFCFSPTLASQSLTAFLHGNL